MIAAAYCWYASIVPKSGSSLINFLRMGINTSGISTKALANSTGTPCSTALWVARSIVPLIPPLTAAFMITNTTQPTTTIPMISNTATPDISHCVLSRMHLRICRPSQLKPMQLKTLDLLTFKRAILSAILSFSVRDRLSRVCVKGLKKLP